MTIPGSLRRCLLALALVSPAAHAQLLTFSGYGTLGVVHSDNDRADYRIDTFKPTGPGHSHEYSFDVDSRIAGQVIATLTPKLSAVVQVLAQQRYDDTYTPVVEWANVRYEVTPDFSVRVGRVVLPIYMLSDARRVGYANIPVRPPVEVYSLVPVTNSDGADASYRWTGDGFINTLHVTAGRTGSRFPVDGGRGTGRADGRRLLLLTNTWESGPATARASYGRADLTVDTVNTLLDAFRQFGPQGAAIADRYDLRDRLVTFVGVGASYDPGSWFASAEWAEFDTRSVLGSRQAWYVNAGARFGKLTPYATYARTRGQIRSDPGLSLAGLPPQLAPVAGALNAALNAQLGASPVQRTLSLGLRWDVARNAALKFQLDEVRPDAMSFGTFGNLQPGAMPGTRARIVSVAVDFVF